MMKKEQLVLWGQKTDANYLMYVHTHKKNNKTLFLSFVIKPETCET